MNNKEESTLNIYNKINNTYIHPKYDHKKNKWIIRCIEENGNTIEKYEFDSHDMASLMYDGLCGEINDIDDSVKFEPELIRDSVVEYFKLTPSSKRDKSNVEVKRALSYFIHNHTTITDVNKMQYTFMKDRKSMYHHSKKQHEFMELYPEERKKIREIFLFIKCKQV